MDTVEYWEQREDEHIKAEEMSDKEVSDRMKTIISNHMKHVQSEIESFYQQYADEEGLPYSAAKKLISELDMEEYGRLAEYYVKNKEDKDIAFSEKANREMKLYNVTMKINRENLVLARMAEHLKNMGAELEHEMETYLSDAGIREFEYQAGLLGDIDLSEKQLKALINSTHLSDKKIWSTRLWQNIGDIQAEVDRTIKDVMLRGQNPKTGVKRLRELTGRSEFEARRLLITESSRVQSEAELISLKDKNIKRFLFIAQIDDRTTKMCRGKHKKDYPLEDAKIGLNVPPLHQFCRSTIAPYINPDDMADGTGVFNLFNDDDDEFEEDDIVGVDPNDEILDDFENYLDTVEQNQGKEYKEQKVEQVENALKNQRETEALNPTLSNQLKDKMQDEHIEHAERLLSEAPDIGKKVWSKYSERMALGKTNESGAHYHPLNKAVNMHVKHTFDNEPHKAKGDTFFHEFGHNIDALAAGDRKLGAFSMFSNHFHSDKYEMSFDEIIKTEANDYINQRHKEFKKGQSKWRKASTYAKLNIEFREKDDGDVAALSDIFSGVTKNKLRINYGHSTNYWKEFDNMVSFEAFANLYGALMTSYKAYEMVKEILPQTVEVFEEILSHLAEEDETDD